MKIKNVNLKWNVLYHDFNKDEIKPCNIFWNGFPEEIAKEIRSKKINNRKELKERLQRIFMSCYWCRSEYEILVSGLFTKVDSTKIDIYYQIEMNLDLITDYVIYKMDLFKKEDK